MVQLVSTRMAGPMPSSRSAARGRELGFIYIWVLLSVAMLGLVSAVVVEVGATSTRRDKEKELLAIGKQFREALRRYQESSVLSGAATAYPESLEDLLEDVRSGIRKRHLRKVFVDPMTGRAEWGLVLMGNKIVGIHSLSIERPIKVDGFDAENLGLRGAPSYSAWVFTYPSGMGASPIR